MYTFTGEEPMGRMTHPTGVCGRHFSASPLLNLDVQHLIQLTVSEEMVYSSFILCTCMCVDNLRSKGQQMVYTTRRPRRNKTTRVSGILCRSKCSKCWSVTFRRTPLRADGQASEECCGSADLVCIIIKVDFSM